MSNYAPSLKEFVCSIPICQPEADLGNMLSIFQHLNCKMLAIPQSRSTWGVINSEDVLSLVAKIWLGDPMALVSHPRNTRYQQTMSGRLPPEIKTLIKPVMVYQGDTQVDDFLRHQQYDSLLEEEKISLIVNREGELQGRLDKDKIIEYLASKSAPPQDLSRPPVLSDVASLIQAIAIPSRIETADGEVVYTNQVWRQLVKDHQNLTPQVSSLICNEVEPNKITQCWIGEQKSSFPLLQSPAAIEHQNGLNFPEELELSKGLDFAHQSAALDLEMKQVSSWNYWRIPVIDNGQETKKEDSYYLVLATPTIQPHQSPTKSLPSNPATATNQILATVSHELKSPLTGIMGLSTLLKGQQLGSLNQRQARYIELIYRSGKQMMGVVDDLLQFTAFTADRIPESELINLEFLCRQLYKEALQKVQSIQETPEFAVNISQPQLYVEQGSEIAIADKLLLSSVLSHLILEALVANETLKPLKIQIKNISGLTTIVIKTQAISSISNVGLNLMIAEYLSELLEIKLTHDCSVRNYQFTLTLPKNREKSLPGVNDLTAQSPTSPTKTSSSLTILCLYPELEVIDAQLNQSHHHYGNFNLKNWSDNYGLQAGYQHRIIEADSLEQAHNLARIWRLDVIILNGYQIAQPSLYLQMLQGSEHLANLPLITLDTKTTEAANQIDGLNVYPCLLPAQQCSIEDLLQVIQIAIGS